MYNHTKKNTKILGTSGTSCTTITWSQHQKQQIQQLGTTFSNVSDEVAPHGGHENSRPMECTKTRAPWRARKLLPLATLRECTN